MTVPSGGPSTINGIIYQMLWSLMRVGQFSLIATEENESILSSATIILEPCNGGDISVVEDGTTIVEQIKTRSDQGTWSVREVVEKVLPDLYLAARTLGPQVKLRFVTDGRIGQWSDVHKFFLSLRDLEVTDKDPLGHADLLDEIKFRRSSSKSEKFWGQGAYTKRRLVERIVEEVRKRNEVGSEELLLTQQNVLRMLANLEFDWERTADSLQSEIESCLSSVVNTVLVQREMDFRW